MTYINVDNIDANNSLRSSTQHEQEIDEAEYIESRSSEALTDDESRALAASAPVESPFGPQETGRGELAAPPMSTSSVWVHPRIRAQRASGVRLPNIDAGAMDRAISAALRFGTPPAAVEEAAKSAREAVQVLRETLSEARHPDAHLLAISADAKQRVMAAHAEAKQAVNRLEAIAAARADEWYDSLTGDLEAKRKAAQKAVAEAYKAYSDWASTRAAAHALAEQQDRFSGGWHSHPDQRELDPTAAIGALAKVKKIVSAEDDFLSGRYLTVNYGNSVPPHTIAYLEKRAEPTAGGSHARQIAWRARANRSDDVDLQRAIEMQDLRPLLSATPLGFTPNDGDDED